MFFTNYLAILSLYGWSLVASQVSDPGSGGNNGTPIPDQYIIQVEPGQIDAVSSRLRTAGAQIVKTYQCSDVFEGFSIAVKNQTADEIKSLTGAKNAWNSMSYYFDTPVPSQILERDIDIEGYSFLPFVNADKVHDANVTGKGVKVGVIDSGINLFHPAFGGANECFGKPGCKVAGGYDFIGDDYMALPGQIPVEDDNPNDGTGHGTHVAGIIAGNTDGFKGIAPDASLYVYRIFSNTSNTTDDVILNAFCRAANDDCDVINCSFGVGNGFEIPNDANAEIAANLVAKGVVVNFAAGNLGVRGPFWVSNSPVNKDLTMVASTDAPVRKYQRGGPGWNHTVIATVDGEDKSFETTFVRAGNNSDNILWPPGLPVVPLSLDLNDDSQACLPLDPNTVPSFPSILLLKEAKSCDLATQVNNLGANNNSVVIIYKNDNEPPVSAPFFDVVVLYTISKAAGETMVGIAQAGGSISVDWALPDPEVLPDPHGGFPSGFTSWGPEVDINISKPDVAAPGGFILSADRGQSWVEMSGTSMATPMLSGVAALFISAHGGRSVWGNNTAYMVKKRLISSGRPVLWRTVRPPAEAPPVDESALAPVSQVGSGLVDAWNVVNSTTQLSFDNIALDDLADFNADWTVEIENRGDTEVTYTFSLQPAGGFNLQSTSNKDYLAPAAELQPKTYIPSVVFPTEPFTVSPGRKKIATFKFTTPTVPDETLLPIYSGNIVIQGKNNESLVVPYTGAAFDVKHQLSGNMFPTGYPKQVSGPDGQDIDEYHTYSFDLHPAVASYPNITMHLKYPTHKLRWDIFKAGWSESQWEYPPVPGQNDYLGPATYYIRGDDVAVFDPSSMSKEDVWGFGFTNVGPTRLPPPAPEFVSTKDLNGRHFMWFGKIGDKGLGHYIEPGNYTMRFAALLPKGDPKVASDWDVWRTPEFTVLG